MRQTSLIILFFIISLIPSYGTVIDSLLNEYEANKKSSDIALRYNLVNLIAREYAARHTEDYDKAVEYNLKAIELAEILNDDAKKADSYFALGNAYYRNNNFQDALEAFTMVLEIDSPDRKKTAVIPTYNQICVIYRALGDYDKAYDVQMEALLLSQTKNDSINLANSYYNLGSIFFYQTRYEQALEYYEKAKEICDLLGLDQFIYSSLAALGSVYEKLGDQEKSLEYNQRSLALAKKLNYETGIGYSLANIGANYLSQGKYQEAEDALKRAIQIKQDKGDTYGMVGNQIDLSKIYLSWQKPKMALPVLKEALKGAVKVNSKSRKSSIYKNLAEVHEKLNQPRKAYNFVKLHLIMKDSVLNEKTLEEMGQSKRRFEVRMKENEIKLLKKENEILAKNEEIATQQIYIFAVSLLAGLILLWWNKSKLKYQNKVNKLLEEKNQILNSKNEEIHIKNKQLEHSNEDLQQFAYVASHDLKEPLRMINSYTNLLQRRYSSAFDESGKEFMHYIIDAVGRMGTLLDDLLDFSRAGTQAAPTDFIASKDVLVMVEANLRHRLETLNGSLIIKNQNLPKVKAHRTQFIQLLQNLISNGVKFKGERDPIVEIDGKKMETGYVFSIKDNGIGISSENLEKVFEMFRRLHTRDEYEGTGIGLATCKRIVSTWGGDIWVESEVGAGSTFFFSVPNSSLQFEMETQLEENFA
ncbi:MAG: tetratricopeptide repeat protein [Bacteroidota bacterium]